MKSYFKTCALLIIGLSVGLALHLFAGLTEDDLLWWLLLGVPGAIIAAGLLLSFVICAAGLYLGAFAQNGRGS